MKAMKENKKTSEKKACACGCSDNDCACCSIPVVGWILGVFQKLGGTIIRFFSSVGFLTIFTGKSIYHTLTPPIYFRLLLSQFINIGYYCLPVVGLTTLFSGMVIALQTYSGFSNYGSESAIAIVVTLSITRELAPVMGGLMVAGRIGASIAAEIGTMRVTEQIDALSTLSTNPYKYLIAPRILAGTLMLPILVFIGDVIGIFGGYLVSVYSLHFSPEGYMRSTWDTIDFIGVTSGLCKAAVFGFIVTLMGCYNGFNSDRGAQGVGAATTNAVVSSSILILIFNYLLTQLFFVGK